MSLKKLSYKALVRPQVEYCSSLWDTHHKIHVQQIERILNKATQFVFNHYSRFSSMSSMKTKLGWENMQSCPSLQSHQLLDRLKDWATLIGRTPWKFHVMQNCCPSAVLHSWYYHTLEHPPNKCDACGQCWRLQMQCIRRPGRSTLTISLRPQTVASRESKLYTCSFYF